MTLQLCPCCWKVLKADWQPRAWDKDKSWAAAAAAAASGQMPRIYTFSSHGFIHFPGTDLYIFPKARPVLGCLLTPQMSSLHKPGSAARAGIHRALGRDFGRPGREKALSPPWVIPELSWLCSEVGTPQNWSHSQRTAQSLAPSCSKDSLELLQKIPRQNFGETKGQRQNSAGTSGQL